MRKIIIGMLLLLLVGVSVGATNYMYDGYNEWEGGEVKHCCASGYCYTLVNAECSEEMWNRAICTKYGMCTEGVVPLTDVEGVEEVV